MQSTAQESQVLPHVVPHLIKVMLKVQRCKHFLNHHPRILATLEVCSLGNSHSPTTWQYLNPKNVCEVLHHLEGKRDD